MCPEKDSVPEMRRLPNRRGSSLDRAIRAPDPNSPPIARDYASARADFEFNDTAALRHGVLSVQAVGTGAEPAALADGPDRLSQMDWGDPRAVRRIDESVIAALRSMPVG
jgi:hypothetical protein